MDTHDAARPQPSPLLQYFYQRAGRLLRDSSETVRHAARAAHRPPAAGTPPPSPEKE